MKTLADLKRDLKIGDSITLVECNLNLLGTSKNLNVKRFVTKKQGNGVYLNPDKNSKTGSFLEFTNAKLTEYDGKEVRIYKPGKRPLTENELRILNNIPSKRTENQKLVERDILSDTNITYYMDEKYFSDLGMEYLHHGRGTKKIDHSTMVVDNNRNVLEGFVIDEQIKGDLELRYTITQG